MPDSFHFSKSRWNIVKDKKLLETPIFSLHQTNLLPEKKQTAVPFYVLNTSDWINVIAMTPAREVILVEQYRAGIHYPTLEIPGGIVDKGELPEEAIRRELLEETGFQSSKWTRLGKVSSNPAILNNYTHLFLAEDCQKIQEQMMDPNEDIAVHMFPFEEFLNLVRAGIIHNAMVVASVAKLLLHFEEET